VTYPGNPNLEYHCENLKSSILCPDISTSTFFPNTKSLFSAYNDFARFADLKIGKFSLFYNLIYRSFKSEDMKLNKTAQLMIYSALSYFLFYNISPQYLCCRLRS